MKQNWVKFFTLTIAVALLAPVSLRAQKDDKDKSDKDEKVKKEVQQITITRKSDKKDEKVVIEINGDKITVNGKPLEEYKDKDGDLSVRLNKVKDPEFLYKTVPGGGWTADNFKGNFFNLDENKAMLGVTTQKTDEGVEIQTVNKESAAEKAGLKENDIIIKVDDKKIEDPDALSEVIQKHKPGEKVTITYLRDKKEQKTTAELTKWKGILSKDFKWDKDMGGMHFDKVVPQLRVTPDGRTPLYTYSGGTPKLGLSIQDSDDGKGVKVINVDEESNAAKAGIKEADVIMEADGKAINNADDMVKVIRESKEKVSIMLKIQRAGKTQNVEVKMPRKLKSATL